ncbi:hypothetical protein MAP00_003642 [Monascus purpureus]|nr:hypothetical protein MAP00_003642 [Monascus purpureus]
MVESAVDRLLLGGRVTIAAGCVVLVRPAVNGAAARGAAFLVALGPDHPGDGRRDGVYVAADRGTGRHRATSDDVVAVVPTSGVIASRDVRLNTASLSSRCSRYHESGSGWPLMSWPSVAEEREDG